MMAILYGHVAKREIAVDLTMDACSATLKCPAARFTEACKEERKLRLKSVGAAKDLKRSPHDESEL